MRDDPRLAEARARPIEDVAAMLGIDGLRRAGREMTGPCPACGGRDRFSINTQKSVFHCRHCQASGGALDLVMWHLGLEFLPALDWLCGARTEVSEAEAAARRAKAADARRASDARAERERARVSAQAREIWAAGLPVEGSPVRDYLALRGLTPEVMPRLPACLRFAPALPYMEQIDGRWSELHRGPAMLAGVVRADGSLTSVHRTWIDLAAPGGKAVIRHGESALAAKKTLGSVKGAAIRLVSPRGFDVLVMAEGIETTLSAAVARALPGAAFWAGVSLGNLAGVMRKVEGARWSGQPDLSDARAFVPPRGLRELVLIEDGDSDPKMTRAKLQSCARRAMAADPGLSARIVPCPPGKDLNDVLRGM